MRDQASEDDQLLVCVIMAGAEILPPALLREVRRAYDKHMSRTDGGPLAVPSWKQKKGAPRA